MPAEAAAERSAPLTVTDKNQTVSDDFKNVSIADGKTPAILEIASTAAADEKGVTTVNSKTINGTFTVGGSKDNVAEANGIWVQHNYPGTVELADGLNVDVDAVGNGYNSSGIYLEGVDTHHGTPDESDAANDEYTNKYHGNISPTTVVVGKGTTIAVKANVPKGKVGEFLNAVALENHFGHMTVKDNVDLTLNADAFQENYSTGFSQLFYGNTTIGNGFSSTVTVNADKDTKVVNAKALSSAHDHPTDFQMPAVAQDVIHIGDDAHLKITINDRNQDVYSEKQDNQEILAVGAFLSRTAFTIGNRMQVLAEQNGIPGRSVNTSHPYNGNKNTGTAGIGIQFSYGRFGDDLVNKIQIRNRNLRYAYGLYLTGNQNDPAESSDIDKYTIFMGDNVGTDVDIQNSLITSSTAVSGIIVNSKSRLVVGKENQTIVRVQNSDMIGHNEIDENGHTIHVKGFTYGIFASNGSQINLGPYGKLHMIQDGGSSDYMIGISINHAAATIGNDYQMIMDIKGQVPSVYAVYLASQGTIQMKDGWKASLTYTGDTMSNATIGAFTGTQGNLTVNDNSTVNVSGDYTGKNTKGNAISGLRNIQGKSVYGNHFTVTSKGDNYETVEGLRGYSVNENLPASVVIRDKLNMTVAASALSDNTSGPYVYGVKNGGTASTVTVGDDACISLSAPSAVQDLAAIRSWSNGKTELGDGAVLSVNSTAAKNNHVVKADTAGTVTFDGGLTLAGNQNAIYSTDKGSSVTAMRSGRKVILGNLEAADSGTIWLNLNTADSYFRGKSTIDSSATTSGAAASTHGLMAVAAAADDSSTVDTTSADTELSLADGARWDMTGTSQLTKLTHENGGLVNMAYNPSYQRLDVNAYSGKNGIFRMKTDLDSEIDGDKVYMSSAAAGSSGLVQVHDESFLLGKEVTGTKHLLLITDGSKNATFSGLSLDEGGLWDVTPTIQNGQYVHDVMGVADANDKQWYLTKLERKINKDTIPLMKAAGNSYALYRLDIDSLRKRMGDLRFRNLKDISGLWARDFHGAYDGRGVDSKYNGFQLGYDYAANDKSVYGFFAERNISNPKYSYGSSKDHGLSGGLYGTWLGDSGVYTDVVAKWGRDDTELHSWGGYPDSANYRTWNESLSVEFGKTFTGDNGLFFEPEAQMVFGHLGSKDYTTSRGKTVSMGSYDSAIGRLGILLGKRVTNRENPYDYYLKFSVLHEFGGERNFHLAAPDGETMDYSEDYRDTWYEAGFGGTWHINGNTSIYADAERSFGGDWHKKWQWNVGVNWQF